MSRSPPRSPRRPPGVAKPKASDTPASHTPEEIEFTKSMVIHEAD